MSASKVGFVANYSKTEFFAAVAEQLVRAGIGVCWITVNQQIDARLRRTFRADDVLLVDARYADWPSPPRGEFKINELIYGDRALRHVPELGRRYLVNIQQPVSEFLATQRPRYVFGEITWAHELLIHRILEQFTDLGGEYLSPATVRIPNGRFAFFRGESEERLLEGPWDDGAGGDAAVAPAGVVEKPEYLAMGDRAVRDSRGLGRRLAKLKRFFTRENIIAHDPTLIHSDWVRLKLRVREEFNKEAYRLVRTCRIEDLKGRPFVLVALHKQPESSIDVYGRYYEDQFQNIVNVWRALPADWLLVLKEHSSAVGDRGPEFYRRLQKLPNVWVVDERSDSHALIRMAEVVVTVSGTIAYEAALMGRPALTLTGMFFNRAGSCRHVTLEDVRRCTSLRELIPPAGDDAEPLREFVHRHSFEGVICDPISDPRCMAPANIAKVAAAIGRILSS